MVQGKVAEMGIWEKYNIHILTAAGIAVGVYLALSWGSMDSVQRAIGIFIVGITLHEWEETRYPGGFFDLMTRMFGISDVTEQKMGRAHGAVVVAIALFAFVPFFFANVRWLAMVPGILGVFEAFVHVAGIRIHHLRRPYTPGMATALLLLLHSMPSSSARLQRARMVAAYVARSASSL